MATYLTLSPPLRFNDTVGLVTTGTVVAVPLPTKLPMLTVKPPTGGVMAAWLMADSTVMGVPPVAIVNWSEYSVVEVLALLSVARK